jgi:sulfur-carrier protein adenylyltransferase/sulfurtransferase
LIPLGEIGERAGEIENGEIVVHCHSGMRSAQAVELLRKAGLTNVYNLEGGIDTWSEEIDPSVPRY